MEMRSTSALLNPNKQLKEAFVSNLDGSSLLDISAVSTIIPLFIILRRSFLFSPTTGTFFTIYLVTIPSTRITISTDGGLRNFLLSITNEFIFTILPSILFFTVLSSWIYPTCLLLLIMVFFVSRLHPSSSPSTISLRDYITSYRVVLTILTSLCILAVDFAIFPRRFAKTETYGSSFMDLGVGSFTLANALVSRQARGFSQVSWKHTLRSSFPLLLLGFARLYSTKSVNYQVHVGEYGVHWNFFFTLAAVSILTSLLSVRAKFGGVFGVIILMGYQIWLSSGNNTYLLSEDRGNDIISRNKEGFFSIFGYWGLYLVGASLGKFLSFEKLRSPNAIKLRVWSLSLVFWFLTVIFDRHVEKISRRMCNVAYACFVIAQNLQVLGVLMMSDFVSGSKLLKIEEAFGANLLGLFLLANVLTGVVNLSMDTLFATSAVSFVVVVGYAAVLTLVASVSHYKRIKFKFW